MKYIQPQKADFSCGSAIVDVRKILGKFNKSTTNGKSFELKQQSHISE